MLLFPAALLIVLSAPVPVFIVYFIFVHAGWVSRDNQYLKYWCDSYRKYESIFVDTFVSKLHLNTQCTQILVLYPTYTYAYTLHVLLVSYTNYYWRQVLLQTLYFRYVRVSVRKIWSEYYYYHTVCTRTSLSQLWYPIKNSKKGLKRTHNT